MIKNNIIILSFIVLIIGTVLIIYNTQSIRCNNDSNLYDKRICLLAIAKNEEMVIDEWIRHYLWQGIHRFYIIDNGSTDNMKSVLDPYIDKGIVSYFYRDEKHKQKEHYNEIYNKYLRKHWDWIIICDIDEYFYYKGNKTLRDYINSVNKCKVAYITSQWKIFGSNMHDKHPESIRKHFLTRKKELDVDFKAIINPLFTDKIDIHYHIYNGGIRIENPKEIDLNHYRIMSKEYFAKVKIPRGDVDHIMHDDLHNWDFFNKWNFNEVYDTELSNLVIKYEENKQSQFNI
jgi:hypothetical protein